MMRLPSLQLSGICRCPVLTAILLTDCSHMRVGYSGVFGVHLPICWFLSLPSSRRIWSPLALYHSRDLRVEGNTQVKS
ncbi:hypothetical protein E2C01_021984 [Portunus trituberculatus]|uniref:Uncharacterized protein n=1 Tax=Portunus trituberculatus TaxID=210409 RepID=A0A5B7E6F4_PORTR|nr:hypothetical protein [Portunus trituberculatus]